MYVKDISGQLVFINPNCVIAVVDESAGVLSVHLTSGKVFRIVCEIQTFMPFVTSQPVPA